MQQPGAASGEGSDDQKQDAVRAPAPAQPSPTQQGAQQAPAHPSATQLRLERELRQARVREQRAEARRRRTAAIRAAAADADARFCGGLLLLASKAHFSFLTSRDVQLAASLNQDYFLGNIFIRTNPGSLDPGLVAACPEAKGQMPREAEPLLVLKWVIWGVIWVVSGGIGGVVWWA